MIKTIENFGWLRIWLALPGPCLALVLVLVWTISPSRYQLETEHLRKAAKIVQRIDHSRTNPDEVQIESRYAGMPYAIAVSSLRNSLDRLRPASIPNVEGGSYTGHGGGSAGFPGADTLVWFNGETRLTPAAFAKAQGEFDELERSYQLMLDQLPVKRRNTVAWGFLLVLLPIGLIFVFGIALEGELGRVFQSLTASSPLVQHPEIQTLDLADVRR